MTPERRIDINTLVSVYGTSNEGSTGQLLGDVIRELLDEIDARDNDLSVIRAFLNSLLCDIDPLLTTKEDNK